MLQKPYTIERFFVSGLIAPECLDELHALFAKLRAGVPHGSMLIKAKTEYDEWQWYLCKYNTIFNNGTVPLYSIIFFRNITDIREKNIATKRFRDFSSAGTYLILFNLEYNLTLDIFERGDGDFPVGLVVNPEDTFSKTVQIFGKKIYYKDRKDFLELLSRDRLLDSHENDVNQESVDCRTSFDNKIVWLRFICHTRKEQYSNHVYLRISCVNIDEKKQAELRIIRNAQIDEVTGVYNRTTFKEKVQEKCKSSDENLIDAFALLDVDYLAKINDTFGFTYGDKVLRDVAQTIRLVLFQDDIIGRVGGGRFALYMSDISDLDTIQGKLEIINSAIFHKRENSIKISVSIGVALCPHDGIDFDELFEKADIALYHAKETGRNKYVLFTDHLPKISRGMLFPIDEIPAQNKRVYIRTFGYFDVFIDGKAILIQHAKAKELLALLVDRRGGFVTSRDIIAGLWENEDVNKVTMARCRKIFMLLNETLKAYGIEDILESNKGSRCIKPEMVNCDLYNYLTGLKEFSHLYKGVYMQNYSWGEFTIADLENPTI
ncbi:diguanylate cyclase [Bacillus sp. T3]|uniref:diguanylate cyclase n=1 Tax=Bacillus sp. T3 TaxID=467262 RepID=UPI002980E2C4|nr:diguanylate cyclase [Bacillus sp. T3]